MTANRPQFHAPPYGPTLARGCALLTGCLALQGAVAADRQWYTLSIDGSRVGYAWRESSVEAGRSTSSELIHIEVEQLRKKMAVQTRIDVSREESGSPARTQVETSIGSSRSGWQGSFDAAARSLKISHPQTTGVQAYAVPLNLILPDQLLESLRPLWAEGRSSVDLAYLEPADARPELLHAERLSAGPKQARVAEILTREPGDGNRQEILWLGGDGQLLRKQRKYLGATLVWNRCEEHCDARVDKPFDLLSKLIVPSPFRIPERAFTGTLRYVISRADGALPQIPSTGEQAVAASGTTAVLTVCSRCGESEQLSETERLRYLRSNPGVESDLPELKAFANRHGGGGSENDIMNRLVEAVRDHMTGPVDYSGNASAAEALRTHSGDCTEYAVLLAALARAKGIPARITYGLVYADRFSGKKDVFSPHTWVQAWITNRWQSYDAGIGQFDATHIALSLGDGSPREAQAGFATPADLRIENLGRVR